MLRVSSVPSLGTRGLDRPPAVLEPLPPGLFGPQAASTRAPPRTASQAPPSASAPSSPTSDERKATEAVLASKRLWTFAGGSELLIKTQLVILKDEDPTVTNQALLQKLSKAPILGMVGALKQGAKIDWRNPDWDGATLLLKAVRTDSLPLALYCLALGADPLAVDDTGRSALHWAAIVGSPEMMGYLLENYTELDANGFDEGGDTPMHLAAFHGHLPVVRLLVRSDADAEAANAGGFTPLDLAQARRVWHVVSYLSESRQHEEDKALKETMQIKDLLRPCNLARASEVRAASDLVPKAKAKK